MALCCQGGEHLGDHLHGHLPGEALGVQLLGGELLGEELHQGEEALVGVEAHQHRGGRGVVSGLLHHVTVLHREET